MGGTSLVTKGILSPIEGDVVFHHTELPLEITAQLLELSTALPDEITADAWLPEAVTTEVSIEALDVETSVPDLEVTAELEE